MRIGFLMSLSGCARSPYGLCRLAASRRKKLWQGEDSGRAEWLLSALMPGVFAIMTRWLNALVVGQTVSFSRSAGKSFQFSTHGTCCSLE